QSIMSATLISVPVNIAFMNSIDVISILPVLAAYIFFYQAEDGIRGRNVTGVQTCALPISRPFFIARLCTFSLQSSVLLYCHKHLVSAVHLPDQRNLRYVGKYSIYPL